MPWKQKSTKMELRLEFVTLAMRENANISALCRRFGISRTTGYKWIRCYKAEARRERKRRSTTSEKNLRRRLLLPSRCLKVASRRQPPCWRFLASTAGGSARRSVTRAVYPGDPAAGKTDSDLSKQFSP